MDFNGFRSVVRRTLMKLEVRLCMHGRSCKNHLGKLVCVHAKFEQTETRVLSHQPETVVNNTCTCSGGMFFVQIQSISKFHRKSIIDYSDSSDWEVAYQEIR